MHLIRGVLFSVAVNKSFDIVGSYNESDSAEFESEQSINLFVDDDPRGRKGKALFPTPGLSLHGGILFPATRGGRRMYVFNDILYAVIDNGFARIDTSLNHTFVGTINTSEGYVGIADNGREIMIVDGNAGWLWTPSISTFVQISAGGFPAKPIDVSILSDRFIVSQADSNILHFSGINDGTSWDALNKFAITSQPDEVVGLRRLNDRLFIMGKRITEVWYDAGDPVLPFRRSDVLPFGCAAVGSITEAFGYLMWLSKTDSGIGSVVISTGTQAVPISTPNIEKEFQKYNTPEDASAFTYRNEDGHTMYQINFTADNKSWAYDINEKRWLRLDYNSIDRHRAQDHAFFNNKHYVVDYDEPKMYELSKKFFTDAGTSIRRLRVTPPLFDPKNRKITLHSLILKLKQGIGGDGDDVNSDPKIRLRISRDGGISYGNELSTSIGKIGRREYRSEFFRFGYADSFVFEIKYDEDTPFILLGCSINIDVQQGGF